jgi:hypothetical protein
MRCGIRRDMPVTSGTPASRAARAVVCGAIGVSVLFVQFVVVSTSSVAATSWDDTGAIQRTSLIRLDERTRPAVRVIAPVVLQPLKWLLNRADRDLRNRWYSRVATSVFGGPGLLAAQLRFALVNTLLWFATALGLAWCCKRAINLIRRRVGPS